MSHSVHPYSFRLGIIRDWKSRWFFRSSYAKRLREDTIMREWLIKKLKEQNGSAMLGRDQAIEVGKLVSESLILKREHQVYRAGQYLESDF